ncbi:hypothetical protein [Paraflavitalea pollutisoli]|uniref:hypothetical protein n=1 Tax=Paraflavitalea pollutisoli TaxID=3034143 RepID=UPI0023ED1CCE|nr:hypothetical protein [Paraflavitalea sp. H1-2-19X]
MKWIVVWMAVCWLPLATIAQTKTLSGQLLNSKSQPIPQATVVWKRTGGLVLQYAISNEQGRFQISFTDTLSLSGTVLEITHLSYKHRQLLLLPGQSDYRIILEESATLLPEVNVKSRPAAIVKGDTTSFNVRSFAREDDRSIGDVIGRMPGLSVDEKGTIYYNGQPVSNLYIHGDDLMDGRYGMATKAINKELIQSVEVIQHHQPIKALEGKKPSDAVALNLVLKDENSLALSGQAMVGGGLPAQYDATGNTIVLSKRIKLLNSLKANNSGTDYADELAQLGSTTPPPNSSNPPGQLLYTGTVGNPNLPKRNYYFNRSAIINLNNLINNRKGLQLRSNIQGFIDRQSLQYHNDTKQYLADDTVYYRESQDAIRKPFALQTAFTVTANKSSYYFSNRLRANISGEQQSSQLSINNSSLGLDLRLRQYELNNFLHYIPGLKNGNNLELQWLVSYSTNPQRLMADTGLHPAILHKDIPYTATRQEVSVPAFQQQLSLTYMIRKGSILQRYEAGLLTERQQLQSTLALGETNDSFQPYPGDAGNDLRWQRDRAHVTGHYTYSKDKIQIGLSLPLIWQSIRYRQEDYNLQERLPRLFLNPSASINWKINLEDYLRLNYSYNNNMGNITGIYRGTLLTNYRSLQASDADLLETRTAGASLYYHYQRSIHLLSAHASLQYNKIIANAITASRIDNNIQRTILLPYENDQSAITANAGVSKYVFALKATFSLTAAFQQSRYNQFINDQWLPWRNRQLSVKAGIDTRLFNRVTLRYNSTAARSNNHQKNSLAGEKPITNTMSRLDQQGELGLSNGSKWLIILRARHLYSQQPGLTTVNYVFTDFNIRYKYTRWRTDFELDLINIANIKSYDLFRISTNLISATRYDIRGRMAMLRATFNL